MAILVEIIFVATVLGRKFIGRNQEQKKVKKGADKQNWGQNQFPHYSWGGKS